MPSYYINNFFKLEFQKHLINACCDLIRFNKTLGKLDAIVVTGVSGIPIGSIISYTMGIPLIISRDHKSSHSNGVLEYDVHYFENKDNVNYIIIDDFIASGNTIKRVIDSMTDMKVETKCIGIILWSKYHSESEELSQRQYGFDLTKAKNIPLFGPYLEKEFWPENY